MDEKNLCPMEDQAEETSQTRERRRERGAVVVREDDPETGETVVRKYPAPEDDHEADS